MQVGEVCISLLWWPGAFCWNTAAWKKTEIKLQCIWCENRQPYVIFNPAAVFFSFDLPTEFNFPPIALACYTLRVTILPFFPTPTDIYFWQLDVPLQHDEDHMRNPWLLILFILRCADRAICDKSNSLSSWTSAQSGMKCLSAAEVYKRSQINDRKSEQSAVLADKANEREWLHKPWNIWIV